MLIQCPDSSRLDRFEFGSRQGVHRFMHYNGGLFEIMYLLRSDDFPHLPEQLYTIEMVVLRFGSPDARSYVVYGPSSMTFKNPGSCGIQANVRTVDRACDLVWIPFFDC